MEATKTYILMILWLPLKRSCGAIGYRILYALL